MSKERTTDTRVSYTAENRALAKSKKLALVTLDVDGRELPGDSGADMRVTMQFLATPELARYVRAFMFAMAAQKAGANAAEVIESLRQAVQGEA